MKLRKFLYLCFALRLAFPCIVVIIWMTEYNLLIGTTGTAFLIQSILNCVAAACGNAYPPSHNNLFILFLHINTITTRALMRSCQNRLAQDMER